MTARQAIIFSGVKYFLCKFSVLPASSIFVQQNLKVFSGQFCNEIAQEIFLTQSICNRQLLLILPNNPSEEHQYLRCKFESLRE